MKRLIVACTLLAVLIWGCFAAYGRLHMITSEIIDELQVVDALVREDDAVSAEAALESAYTLWQKRQPTLGILVRHNELDDIQKLFHRTMQSLADQNLNEYRIQLRELSSTMKHLTEIERPNLQNIF